MPRLGGRGTDANGERRGHLAAVAQMTRNDVRWPDRRAARHDHGPLDSVLQLAHVAGPVVAHDPVPGRVLESGDRLAVLLGEAPEELVGEELDVVRSLAQWRQIDLHDSETIVQVLAQLVVGEGLL